MSRRIAVLVGGGVAVVLALEAVPFYMDWLWFEEVGYLPVFLRTAATRGSILIGVGLVAFLFVIANLGPQSVPGPPTSSGSSRSRSASRVGWCWSRSSGG